MPVHLFLQQLSQLVFLPAMLKNCIFTYHSTTPSLSRAVVAVLLLFVCLFSSRKTIQPRQPTMPASTSPAQGSPVALYQPSCSLILLQSHPLAVSSSHPLTN